MIKVNWNIQEEEKNRILNLHETATKKQYLMSEQWVDGGSELNPKDFPKTSEGELKTLPPPNVPAWDFCGYDVIPQGGNYFIKMQDGFVKLPKLSQLEGTLIDGGKNINFVGETLDGIEFGNYISTNPRNPCSKDLPDAYANYKAHIVYFDDVQSNLPCYGVIDWTGEMKGYAGDLLNVKPQKDREGVVIKWGRTRSKSFVLNVGVSFKGTPLKYKEVPKTIPPQEKTLELNINSPFNFDNVTLTDEANKQFLSFIQQVNDKYKGVGGNVEVITSASIDGKSEEEINGAYPDCVKQGKKQPRKEYNFCLSKKRAESIVQILKNSLPETKFNFIAKPIGETDQFAPGKKWPEVKNSKETADNRKLIIKLPQITIKDK